MLCILCVTTTNQIIEIFDEIGIQMDVCNVISKHFWLKPNAEEPNSKVICSSCWTALDSFHRFYEMVEKAHANQITLKVVNEGNASDSDNSYAFPELFTPEYDVKSEPIDNAKSDLETNEVAVDVNKCRHEPKSAPSQRTRSKRKLGINSSPDVKMNIKSTDDMISKIENGAEISDNFKSDTESEVPLANLSKQKLTRLEKQNNGTKSPEQKDSNDIGAKLAFEEKERVPCQKFDEFIRKNMDLSCTICHKSMSSFFILKEHYQSVHNENGFVICCEKKFESRHTLVHHILLHGDPDFYKCNICNRVLANKKSLKNHMETHKARMHTCEKCNKSFIRKEKLLRHMKTHVRPDQICEQCGKVTKSLKQHQLREHSGIPRERVQCIKCGASLADKSTLHTHMKYQHPKTEALHVCNICGKISASGYGLKRHILYMHKCERRHKCPMCAKAFKAAQILRPDVNDMKARVICTPCWCTLETFHKFYLQVEQAHAKLQDVLAVDKNELKAECDNDNHQHIDPSGLEPFDEVAADLLNADIKLEVQEDIEVTLLPEIVAAAGYEKKEESPNKRKHSTDSKRSLQNEAPPASSTRSRMSAEKTYKESSSEDEADNDNNPDWQNENSDNDDDDDSDYVDNSSKNNKGDETLSVSKKRGRPKKGESRETSRKRKRTSEEQSKKMERIQEYDDLIAKNMKLTCSICLNVSPNFAVLKKHYRVVHNECGYATCCGKKFRKRGVLVDHIHTHQNPEYFKCTKCGKVLANRKCLDCHMLTHDTEKQRIYQCDQCTMSFYTRPLLTRHLQTHISVRNIKCPECDKFFSTQDILRTHINNVHNSAYNRICDQCGKLFRRPDSFRRHQLEHDGITQPLVPCEKCGVKLTSKYGLKRHMESMHPETEVTHVCSTCGKVAPSAAALQRHISYMHKMERKYKCPMCDKAFKKTGGLKPNKDDENARYICTSCWGALDSFHRFYQQVEEAHISLVRTTTNNSDVLKQEDVIPTEVEESGKFPVPDFLTADVKLEVKEDSEVNLQQYDPLPDVEEKIEVNEISKAKRQKQSESFNSDDSESEIPLANLAKTRSGNSSKSKPTAASSNDDGESGAEWQDNHSADDDDDESEFEVKKTPKRKAITKTGKKRGRPCKNAPKNNTPKQTTEEQLKKRELSQEYDEIIHKNIKLTCNLCLLPLANFFILKKHYRSKHNERGYALCCGKKFLKRGILVDHIYTHLNPEHFKCDKCDKVLADRRCLEVHMNTHITEKQRIYQCDQCCKSFFKKPLLTRHMHIHIPEEERKFPCEECNKFFPSNYTLRAHINNVHQNAYAKICDQCGKSIRGREAFQRHLLEHAGIPIPSVQCDKCGAKLKNKYGLKRHMNSMHAESSVPHVCNICGKIAPNPAALQRHYSYVHKCERNHKCPMCDKAFKKAGGLKEHMTTHTGEVLYTCPHCPKTFNSNANMHSHRKKMHRKEWEENRRHPHMGSTASAE